MKIFKIGFEGLGEEFSKELSVVSKLKHKTVVNFIGKFFL
jgi:hypothetical protein